MAAQGWSSEEGCEMSWYTQGEVRDSQGECVEWEETEPEELLDLNSC